MHNADTYCTRNRIFRSQSNPIVVSVGSICAIHAIPINKYNIIKEISRYLMSKGTKKEQGYVKEGAPETVKSKNSKSWRVISSLCGKTTLFQPILNTSSRRWVDLRCTEQVQRQNISIYMYI